MKAIVLGAGGILGHDVIDQSPPGCELTALTHKDLDITDRAGLVQAITGLHAEVVINAAAYTKVDQAESEPDEAFRVNRDAVASLAEIAKRDRFLLVHISTDYVFDGDSAAPYVETSEPHPLNTYGASKLAGEEALRASGARHLIVRTQWLFGSHGRSFPRTMWERATTGKATRVVDDQLGRPTYTRDLASAIWRLVLQRCEGTCHVANSGDATWFDVASRVFARAKQPDLLTKCSTADYPTAARRPRRSILSTQRYEHEVGQRLPCWETALDHFLAHLTGGTP
jgi:dTDP-4-dehydrorhamnose reductase